MSPNWILRIEMGMRVFRVYFVCVWLVEGMWWNALYRLKAHQLLPLLVWSGTGLVFISSSSPCSSSSSSAQPPKRPEVGGTKVTVCADCIWGPWAERKKCLQILLPWPGMQNESLTERFHFWCLGLSAANSGQETLTHAKIRLVNK